ncbi:MFS transporter [Bacillus massiliglaciei]|uniref:MFS transporter n=1 Tax=Bacillus massiliglaciei TaxID=1816693 RepID=UPI000A9F48B8|nr:MFS transporter [Bacillus massiliglaciei]
MKELLNNKSFVFLMLAQMISGLGDWLSLVAIMTLVGLKWNASPMEVSFIMLCLVVPMALLGPMAGALSDRLSRKVIMITSDFIRSALILLLAGAESIEEVYLYLFLIGLFSALFIPAKNGMLKELVVKEHVKGASSFTSMIDAGTKIIGPVLSGILVSTFGTNPVFFIDAATFFVSALLLLFLPKSVQTSASHKKSHPSSFQNDFAEGLTFIFSKSHLLTGLFFLGCSLFILQLSDSQIIVLIRELTLTSPNLFGYIVTASGLGMFLAGFVLTKKTNYNAFALMLIGVFIIGFSFGGMALLTYFDVHGSLIWAPLMGLFAGCAASLILIPFQASVQLETPVHMTGRVFGLINSVTTTATIFGPLLGGWLATVFGAVPTFIMTASFLLFLAVLGFLMKNKIERSQSIVSKSQQ